MPEPKILNLDLITETPEPTYVGIDGKQYALRDISDLHFFMSRRGNALSNRLAELEAKPKPSEADMEEYDAITVEICEMILDAPADVQARLKSFHRVRVIQEFVKARDGAALAQMKTPRRRTAKH